MKEKVYFTLGHTCIVKHYRKDDINDHKRVFESYVDFLDHLHTQKVDYIDAGAETFHILTNKEGVYKIFN